MSVPEPRADTAPLVTEASPTALGSAPRGRFYIEIGYAFAAVGALLFSTKGIAIKLAYQEPIDATLLLALRMGLAVPVYAVIAFLAVKDSRRRGIALPSPGIVLKAARCRD